LLYLLVFLLLMVVVDLLVLVVVVVVVVRVERRRRRRKETRQGRVRQRQQSLMHFDDVRFDETPTLLGFDRRAVFISQFGDAFKISSALNVPFDQHGHIKR
jgi:flagellar biosynthesis/type III secretory pathway M-ring protein FliF/YscJ